MVKERVRVQGESYVGSVDNKDNQNIAYSSYSDTVIKTIFGDNHL
jgi:hypothetical protein